MLGWVKLNDQELERVLKFIGKGDATKKIISSKLERYSIAIKGGKYKVQAIKEGIALTVVVNYFMWHVSQPSRGDNWEDQQEREEKYEHMISF